LQLPRFCCETGVFLDKGEEAVVATGMWSGERRTYTFHPLIFQLLCEVDSEVGQLRQKIIEEQDGNWFRHPGDLIQCWNLVCPDSVKIRDSDYGHGEV
jgi:hypothetical protein